MPSSSGDVLDAFQDNRKRPSVGQVFDHFANASRRGDKIAWGQKEKCDFSLIHSYEQSKTFLEMAINTTDYIDIHCWRFTPESFRLIMDDLCSLNLSDLKIIQEYPTNGCEFFVTLSKNVSTVKTNNRVKMLQNALDNSK